MKVIELVAQNVKALKAVEVKPAGAVVCVGGDNGQGKSSLLDAIVMGLSGKRSYPAQPIRKGEKKASIDIDLGDLKIHRTITASGGELVVTSADGKSLKNPQALLSTLYSDYTFDPLSFQRLSPKEKLEALQKLLGLSFDDLDARHAALNEEIHEVDNQVQWRTAQVARLQYPEGTPDAPIDVESLQRKVKEAEGVSTERQAHLQKIDRTKNKLEGLCVGVERNKQRIEQLKKEQLELEKQCAEAEEHIARGRQILSGLEAECPAAVDIGGLLSQLSDASKTNQAVERKREAMEHVAARVTLVERARRCREEKAALVEERRRRISEAEMPVDGMSIEDGELVFNGIPLEQCSTAEQLRISVKMGLSLNPKLRVMLIKDGSLLDSSSLKLISEIATQEDAQVWIERVGHGQECQVIIQEGEVVS